MKEPPPVDPPGKVRISLDDARYLSRPPQSMHRRNEAISLPRGVSLPLLRSAVSPSHGPAALRAQDSASSALLVAHSRGLAGSSRMPQKRDGAPKHVPILLQHDHSNFEVPFANSTVPDHEASAFTSVRADRKVEPAVQEAKSTNTPAAAQVLPHPPPTEAPKTLRNKRSFARDFMDFLGLREPSAAALNNIREQQRKHHKIGDTEVTTGGVLGTSERKLPINVPRVNSKWDGMPSKAHARSKPLASQEGRHNSQPHIPLTKHQEIVPPPQLHLEPLSGEFADRPTSHWRKPVDARSRAGSGKSASSIDRARKVFAKSKAFHPLSKSKSLTALVVSTIGTGSVVAPSSFTDKDEVHFTTESPPAIPKRFQLPEVSSTGVGHASEPLAPLESIDVRSSARLVTESRRANRRSRSFSDFQQKADVRNSAASSIPIGFGGSNSRDVVAPWPEPPGLTTPAETRYGTARPHPDPMQLRYVPIVIVPQPYLADQLPPPVPPRSTLRRYPSANPVLQPTPAGPVDSSGEEGALEWQVGLRTLSPDQMYAIVPGGDRPEVPARTTSVPADGAVRTRSALDLRTMEDYTPRRAAASRIPAAQRPDAILPAPREVPRQSGPAMGSIASRLQAPSATGIEARGVAVGGPATPVCARAVTGLRPEAEPDAAASRALSPCPSELSEQWFRSPRERLALGPRISSRDEAASPSLGGGRTAAQGEAHDGQRGRGLFGLLRRFKRK